VLTGAPTRAPCLSKFILMPGHHRARRARPPQLT
jgi:hypothetical protein